MHAPGAGDAEGFGAQHVAHDGRVVVVAGDGQHRDVQRGQRVPEQFVAGPRLVLDEIPAGDDRGGFVFVDCDPFEHCLERRPRRDAAHPGGFVGMQMRVGDMQQANDV